MFDKDFFRFALSFAAIVVISIGILYAAGRFNSDSVGDAGRAETAQE